MAGPSAAYLAEIVPTTVIKLATANLPTENRFSELDRQKTEIMTKLNLPFTEKRVPSKNEADQLHFALSKVCDVAGLTLDQAAEIRGGDQRDASLKIDRKMFDLQKIPPNLVSQSNEIAVGKGLFVTQPTELTSSGGRVIITQVDGARTEIFFMVDKQLEVSVNNPAGRLIYPAQEGGNRKIDLTNKDHYQRIAGLVDYLIRIHVQNPRFKEGFPNNQLQRALTDINNTLSQVPVSRDFLQAVAAEPSKPGETLFTPELKNQLEQSLSQLTDERSKMVFRTIISNIDSLKIYNQEDVKMILKMLQDKTIIDEWNTFTTELDHGRISVIDPDKYRESQTKRNNYSGGFDRIVNKFMSNYFNLSADVSLSDEIKNKFFMSKNMAMTVLSAAEMLRVRMQVARTVDESAGGDPYRVVEYLFNNLLITFYDAATSTQKERPGSPKVESDYQQRSEWLKCLYKNWKQKVVDEIRKEQEKSAKEVEWLTKNTLY